MKICNFVEWELQKFRDECNFTDRELEYFNLKAKDKTNVQISIAMCLSESSVEKLGKKVRKKMLKIL